MDTDDANLHSLGNTIVRLCAVMDKLTNGFLADMLGARGEEARGHALPAGLRAADGEACASPAGRSHA